MPSEQATADAVKALFPHPPLWRRIAVLTVLVGGLPAIVAWWAGVGWAALTAARAVAQVF
jgi:hypothetical protein